MISGFENLRIPRTLFLEVLPKIGDLIHKAKVHRHTSNSSRAFALLYPVASFFVFLVAISISDIIMSIALGVPYIKLVFTFDKFLLISIIWYLVFMSPKDLFYGVTQEAIVKTIIGVLCEVNRKNTFSRLSDRALRMVSKTYFSAISIVTVYCLAFPLAIYPLDQLMRGSTIEEHETKRPHFGTYMVLMYSASTCAFLYLRELELPMMSKLGFLTLDHVFRAVMIAAISMSIFTNLIGWDAVRKLKDRFGSKIKPKAKRGRAEAKMVAEEKSFDAEEDSPPVESPRKLRTTRKRQSTKL